MFMVVATTPKNALQQGSEQGLFVLPYNLLELIATVYFQRQEAVKVLCVNSQFHKAFSRAVWHHLCVDEAIFSDIPTSAWINYGHLVRVLDISDDAKKTEVDAISLPKLLTLRMNSSQIHCRNFWGIELRKLRRSRLSLILSEETGSDDTKCVGLARSCVQQSSLSLHVNWRTKATVYTRQNIVEAFDVVSSKIGVGKITHHKVSITLRMRNTHLF
ncbi:hypothetical protein GQ42DRAFT_180011 [Ramicandelaber brevisporus]|nr:hypothetical protein GQ42DRAFT_180011 [Ramicandelaber brevisporus]